MPFVEHRLMRRVLKRAFDVFKFGEVAFSNITEDDLRAKPAGAATLNEARLPFHDLPIPARSITVRPI